MGLQATFWNNQTPDNWFNDAPPIPPTTSVVASVSVATIDWNFDSQPVNGMPYDDFVVKFEGYITFPESGIVDLQCLADDGCMVIIDGATVINEWYDKGMEGNVYQYISTPNQSLPINVWYYENGGGAAIQLRWKLPSGNWETIPASAFTSTPVIPIVESPSETHTVASPETDTAVNDSQTAVSDTQTSLDMPETPTVVVDSPTVVDTPTYVDTTTPVVETTTVVDTPTAPVEETPLSTPIPVVVQPEPTRPIEIQVPVIPPEPQPDPEPQPEVVDEPTEIEQEPPLGEPPLEEQPVVEEPLPVEEPSELPVEEETNESPIEEPEILEPLEPTPEPSTQPVVEPEPMIPPDVAPEPPVNSEPMVTLDNGVVLTEEEAVAIVLLQNPAELLTELFTDPGAVLTALGSVGADMTPEVREKSEKVVVSAIIAGGIATQSAAAAAGAAAYRRKP